MTQYALLVAAAVALVAGTVAMLFMPGAQWPAVALNVVALAGFGLNYWVESKRHKSDLEVKVDELEGSLQDVRAELSALKMAAGFVQGGQ